MNLHLCCYVYATYMLHLHSHDILTLAIAMDIEYDADEYRLFIDGAKTSLKAVLLHRSNKQPCIPVAYSTETEETYEALGKILNDIKYEEHNWKLCCDLKVVAILCGLQKGNIKYPCFLCNWDSRYKEKISYSCQYDKKDWELRQEHCVGDHNLMDNALVPKENFLLPPLHIKLGIVKNFVKHVYGTQTGVPACLKTVFKVLSDEKFKNGVLNGPDIRTLIKRSSEFEAVLDPPEAKAWKAEKRVIQRVLGKHRSRKYKELVEKMMAAFKAIGVHMSTKVHLLHRHIDYFGNKFASESDEQGEISPGGSTV